MRCALCGVKYIEWRGLKTHPDNECVLSLLDFTQIQINRINAAIVAAKELGEKEESERWGDRLNFVHAEFDVDGSVVDSGDPLDVIESEIRQAIGKVDEEARKDIEKLEKKLKEYEKNKDSEEGILFCDKAANL